MSIATVATIADFYKLLAWSFLAGFSEKFVLSKLDALLQPPKARP